jgi:hypothetical protein
VTWRKSRLEAWLAVTAKDSPRMKDSSLEIEAPTWGGRLAMCIKLAMIGVFVWLTNFGFLERVELLIDRQRMATLLAYVLIWAIAIVAFLVIAFHRRARIRLLRSGA